MPNRPEIAFVVAADRGDNDTFGPAEYRDWYATRRLWTWGYTGGNPTPLMAAGTGIAAPSWSHDDNTLLYVKDNSLWLLNTTTNAAPIRITGPLFATLPPPNYYGAFDWRSRFAWSG